MPANLFTLTKAGDLIKNKAIANAVNIKRNGKAIAWLYQNAGNILDYKDGDKVKLDLTAIQSAASSSLLAAKSMSAIPLPMRRRIKTAASTGTLML